LKSRAPLDGGAQAPPLSLQTRKEERSGSNFREASSDTKQRGTATCHPLSERPLASTVARATVKAQDRVVKLGKGEVLLDGSQAHMAAPVASGVAWRRRGGVPPNGRGSGVFQVIAGFRLQRNTG